MLSPATKKRIIDAIIKTKPQGIDLPEHIYTRLTSTYISTPERNALEESLNTLLQSLDLQEIAANQEATERQKILIRKYFQMLVNYFKTAFLNDKDQLDSCLRKHFKSFIKTHSENELTSLLIKKAIVVFCKITDYFDQFNQRLLVDNEITRLLKDYSFSQPTDATSETASVSAPSPDRHSARSSANGDNVSISPSYDSGIAPTTPPRIKKPENQTQAAAPKSRILNTVDKANTTAKATPKKIKWGTALRIAGFVAGAIVLAIVIAAIISATHGGALIALLFIPKIAAIITGAGTATSVATATGLGAVGGAATITTVASLKPSLFKSSTRKMDERLKTFADDEDDKEFAKLLKEDPPLVNGKLEFHSNPKLTEPANAQLRRTLEEQEKYQCQP